MRLGAPAVAEIKSQLLGSLRTVPKTILERGRQAVDLIAAVQRCSARFKITWFRNGVLTSRRFGCERPCGKDGHVQTTSYSDQLPLDFLAASRSRSDPCCLALATGTAAGRGRRR